MIKYLKSSTLFICLIGLTACKDDHPPSLPSLPPERNRTEAQSEKNRREDRVVVADESGNADFHDSKKIDLLVDKAIRRIQDATDRAITNIENATDRAIRDIDAASDRANKRVRPLKDSSER